MELTPEHLSKLDEMVTLLSISDDLTIAFVRCNEPVLCDALHSEIKDRVRDDIFIYDIAMDRNSTNLLQLLNDAVNSDIYSSKIEDNKKIAFFVSGLDDAIEKKTDEGRSEALALLNMMRENFMNIGHTIIIWINTASLSMVLKEAQDFFSWRTTVFEFDMERRKQVSQVFEFGGTDFAFLDKNELEERWDNYSKLLKEYQEKGIEDPYKFADWNYNMGMIKLLMGYATDAVEYFEKSLILSEKTGTKNGIANSLDRLGNAYRDMGLIDESIKYHKQALEISRAMGDRHGEGAELGNLGNAYSDLGMVEEAIAHHKQALEISKIIGDMRGEGVNLGNLGNAYSDLGLVKEAIVYYKQALEISRAMGDMRGESADLGNLGLAYRALGLVEEAIEYHKQALEIARKIGDRRGEGADLGNLGNAYSALGSIKESIEYHKQALEIAREIGDRRGEGADLGNLGNAYSTLGLVEEPIEYHKQALEIAREIGDRRGEGAELGSLGNAYSALGQVEKAIEYCEKSLAIGKEIKDPRLVSFCENNLNSMKKSISTQS